MHSQISPLASHPELLKQMQPQTWPVGHPAKIGDLVYVEVPYYGFDEEKHTGVFILNKEVAHEIIDIFAILYEHHFEIQTIQPISAFSNNDEVSMEANNSSAFNCREVTNHPGLFSQHAYGRAIDINPKINPYVNKHKNLVLPQDAASYVDRSVDEPGKITKRSFIYQLFTARGWDWGGNWHDVQDYQHFEKRANSEKRHPDGYGATS